MEGMTPDQLKRRVIELEALIVHARLKQIKLLQMADAWRRAAADGCRPLPDWVVGHVDRSGRLPTR
jgi:hypothetical protein